MDFHTVKRKLADLRKSLELNGSMPARRGGRKVGKTKSNKAVASHAQGEKDQGHRSPGSQPLTLPHGSVATAQLPQMGYMGVGGTPQQTQQQATPTFPHNLQLSMLSLQHLNGNHPCSSNPFTAPVTQHLSQQALNLQTGTVASNLHSVEQPPTVPASAPNQPTSAAQPLSLNLHSVGGPMSSYYLCFGHVSNLIPLPVSNAAPVTGHTLSPQSSTSSFPAQHNTHQQFTTPTLLQPHSSTSIPISQTSMVNSTHPQANLISSYHTSHQPHMY